MARALKVFRTPIGFHDAYVAAASQKAALTAWGSDANLFARGVAELVTDPELVAEPLAHPGKVIKRLRGTAAEHFGALPKRAGPRPVSETAPPTRSATKTAKPKTPKARPSRAKLSAAEQRLVDAEQRQRAELSGIAKREAALQAERKRLEHKMAAENRKLAAQVRAATIKYDAALEKWRMEE